MIKKLLLKLSSLLFRTHLYIERLCKEKKLFEPYILKYQPSNGTPKIVHINGNFIVGGTTQLIIDIIERTSDEYTHQVIVPSYAEPLPYQPVAIKKFSISQMSGLYEYLKSEKPALVHIHYWVREKYRYEEDAMWYTTVFNICSCLGIKIIQNINVPTRPFENSAVVHNVFVSNYVYKNYNLNNSVSSSVIYPGSNFSHFVNEHIEHLPINNIGMAYRLDQDKLSEEVIELFIRLVKKNQQIKCYIIGDGYYYPHYTKRVKEENLEGNIVFTGMVSYTQLPRYYKNMSVFVTPVHDESFGQVTPFAMSMGLAIAGYNTGALPEILGYTDTLVEYGDIDKLIDVILSLVTDNSKRIALGKRNQQRAHSNYSVESMITEYRELYHLHVSPA